MSQSETPRIGYVVKVYPRFSETFVVTEILAREAAGEDLAGLVLADRHAHRSSLLMSAVAGAATGCDAAGTSLDTGAALVIRGGPIGLFGPRGPEIQVAARAQPAAATRPHRARTISIAARRPHPRPSARPTARRRASRSRASPQGPASGAAGGLGTRDGGKQESGRQ